MNQFLFDKSELTVTDYLLIYLQLSNCQLEFFPQILEPFFLNNGLEWLFRG